jgi:hypothetical protein
MAFRQVRLLNLGYAQFSGRSPRIFTVWNGSAERFRTSDGIAALVTYDFLGKATPNAIHEFTRNEWKIDHHSFV